MFDHSPLQLRDSFILIFERLPAKYMTVRPFAIDYNGKQVLNEVINACCITLTNLMKLW